MSCEPYATPSRVPAPSPSRSPSGHFHAQAELTFPDGAIGAKPLLTLANASRPFVNMQRYLKLVCEPECSPHPVIQTPRPLVLPRGVRELTALCCGRGSG